MKKIAKIVNDWKPSNIFARRFILDVWQGSECVSSNLRFELIPFLNKEKQKNPKKKKKIGNLPKRSKSCFPIQIPVIPVIIYCKNKPQKML